MRDCTVLIALLRARVVTVPKPGTEPWEPTSAVEMTIGGGPHEPGDSAGVITVPSLDGKWRVQEHVYAVEPLASECAAVLEQLTRALPCGHSVEFDDSYGGCVFCQYRDGFHDCETALENIEAERDALRLELEQIRGHVP